MMSVDDEREGPGLPGSGMPSGHVDDWRELVVDYLDGRLTPELKAAVKHHLDECPECAARVQTQQSVITFLQSEPLQDPPADLEDQVLGEVLFPSKPVPQVKVVEQGRATKVWRRKVRPWIPATVAVAALLIAMVTYGLVRSGSNVSPTGSVTATTAASQGQVAGTAADKSGGAESTATALGATATTAGATTTAAAVTTTSAAPSTTIASASTTSAASIPPATQDKKTMVNNLKDAHVPAYLIFAASVAAPPAAEEPTTTVPTDGAGATTYRAVSAAKADEVVGQIVSLTGLQPLENSLSLGGPTFAAFVPRDDANQLVDLVRSIGADLGLIVTLDMEPPPAGAEAMGRLLDRKAELPVLYAQRTPQPAVSGWQFTTSTLAPADGRAGEEAPVPPDEATHVLVIFYITR